MLLVTCKPKNYAVRCIQETRGIIKSEIIAQCLVKHIFPPAGHILVDVYAISILSHFYFQGIFIGVTPNYLCGLGSYRAPGGLPGVIFC